MKITIISASYMKDADEIAEVCKGKHVYLWNTSRVRDPWRIMELRKMNRTSPDVQAVLMNCMSSKLTVQLFQQNAYALAMDLDSTDNVTFIFTCRKGKYQSPAVAELVAAKLRGLGLNDVTVRHLRQEAMKTKKAKAGKEE